MNGRDIYGGRDPRELPAYSVGEAAQYLRVPAATLRSWFAGRTYPRQHGGPGSFKPVLTPADAAGRLSFFNLVEAHVLRALRTQHGVPIRAVRPALEHAARELGIPHVLLSDDLLTSAGEIFLEHYGELINLSRSGQFAMRKVLEAHLRRVERDDRHIPIRLYPFLTFRDERDIRSVVIDPCVSFGKPVVVGSGIKTSVLAQRLDAGETIDELARDYGLDPALIEDAILFEKAA
jgi:uncharacterized protein (DUF433 family)